MGYGHRVKGDPYWIAVRYAGECRGCGAAIPRGADAFYYPKGRALYGADCGCGLAASAEFEDAARAESCSPCDEELGVYGHPDGWY